jgi:hypothetical protein
MESKSWNRYFIHYDSFLRDIFKSKYTVDVKFNTVMKKKRFSKVLRSATGAQWTVKNESRFSTAKSTSFYSEFNADSEYVILFQKYRGQKNDLIDTCPFMDQLRIQSQNADKLSFMNSIELRRFTVF